MNRKILSSLLIATSLCGTACARQGEQLDCGQLLQGIVNADDVKAAPNPLEAALVAMEEKAPNECKGTAESYLGAKAYFSYGLGRINESEELLARLDWRVSDESLVLTTAVLLIVHHRRLGNDLRVAEELAQRIVRLLPEDPKSHLLLGEVLIDQGRDADVAKAFNEAKAVRRRKGLNELNDFDIDFVSPLAMTGHYSDALTIFLAAEKNERFKVWERENVILSGLLSALQLGDDSAVQMIMSKTESRRPDVASSAAYLEFKRSFESASSTP